MQLVLYCLLATIPLGLTLVCYTCNQGFQTSQPCSNELPKDMVEECTIPGAQCVEAVEWFQRGALKTVRRQCWPRYNDTRPNFCKNYKSPVGVLKFCKTCNTSRCNGDVIYRPAVFLECRN